MRISLRCFTAAVAQELLDGSDVVAIFEQVGRGGVTKVVAGGLLRDAGHLDACSEGTLDPGGVHGVPEGFPGIRRRAVSGSGKDPLPGQFQGSPGILPPDALRDRRSIGAPLPVQGQDQSGVLDPFFDSGDEAPGKHGHPVLVSLGPPDVNLAALQVQVFHSQIQGFSQSEP